MKTQDFIALKIVLTGDANVVKGSLIQREIYDHFIQQRDKIGIDFKVKYYQINQIQFKVQLWNGIVHSYEKFKQYNQLYYKINQRIIKVLKQQGLCFCLNDMSSLNSLERRLKIIIYIETSAILLLIGCKIDIQTSVFQEIIDQFTKKTQSFLLQNISKVKSRSACDICLNGQLIIKSKKKLIIYKQIGLKKNENTKSSYFSLI